MTPNVIMKLPTNLTEVDVGEINSLYDKTDKYQPVFGLEDVIINNRVSRGCVDRCKFLELELSPDIRNLRILDIGCSLGYLTLYLGQRGAKVVGIDHLQENVDFCSAIAKKLKIDAHFRKGVFSEEFCHEVQEGQYDVIFLFSVLHHVIARFGLTSVQRMMADLLAKCDMLYVELALKTENVPFDWKDKIPENELDIFAGISDLEIVRMDEFPALNNTVIRPIYRVRKTTKKYCDIVHSNLRILRSDIKDGRTRTKKYCETENLFSKVFVIESDGIFSRFVRELYASRKIGRHKNFLPILGDEIRGDIAVITYPRIDEETLLDLLRKNAPLNKRLIAEQIAEILKAFSDAGLYWNDLRSHNILIEGNRAIAIDLEASSSVETENTLDIFLWLLHDIGAGRPNTQENDIFKNGNFATGRPPFGEDAYHEDLRSIAKVAVRSKNVKDFIDRYFG